MQRRHVLALPFISAFAPAVALAQGSFPDRPIKMIVPFAPGTALDLVARSLAPGLGDELKTSIVIDNRIGASGVIGTESVAKAPADGYTLLFTAPAHYINEFAFSSLPYNAEKDFRPISKVSNAQLVMVVPGSSPFNNVKDVIAYAKANPKKLRFSSSGQGSTIQLAFSLFNSMAAVEIESVPYKSGSQALTDVMAEHIDITFTAVASALPLSKSGKLKLLGVSGLKRSRSMPDVPTIAEAALPGFELTSWSGALAPSQTPDGVIEKLNAAILKVSRAPAFQEKLVAMGVEPDVLGTPEFQKQITSELPKWKRLTELTGVMQSIKQ